MDDVKKRLKILLRPGEPEKRPELTWPKNMKKEPVEVVGVSANAASNPCHCLLSTLNVFQEVIELLKNFRTIMRKNFETMDVDKIQSRW
jgi:inositol hexakisphosphate/diphosphoinositol-pentakisphosphate kinase